MKKVKLIWAYGVTSLVIIGFIMVIIRQSALSLYPKYTIGTTFGDYFTGAGVKKVDYFFFVNGIRYEGAGRLRNNAVIKGGKYWVRFSAKMPSSSEILFDEPVLNDFNVPLPGLDTIPIIPVVNEHKKLDSLIMNYK